MLVDFNHILSITFTLFAVIDIIGSVPILISLKAKIGHINPQKVTLVSGLLMIVFLLIGESLLTFLGVDVSSFAIAGSIVMFILGLEMVLGIDIFRTDPNLKSGSIVPVAFPIIAGSGTLTTILSLKSAYNLVELSIGIAINLILIFIVLKSTGWLEKKIGEAGMLAIRKFFGVILLAISVKIFKANIHV